MHSGLEHTIRSCQNQDRNAQQQLYEFTYKKLKTAVAVYAKHSNETDWIFNLGMLKVFTSLNNYKSGTNYLGWARTILVRTAVDNIRSNKKYSETLVPVQEHQEYSSQEFEELMNRIETQDLVLLIQSLPSNEKLVFNMFELEGFSHVDIEKQTGIKKNTSKWLLAKAKTSLRDKIQSSNHLNVYNHGK